MPFWLLLLTPYTMLSSQGSLKSFFVDSGAENYPHLLSMLTISNMPISMVTTHLTKA